MPTTHGSWSATAKTVTLEGTTYMALDWNQASAAGLIERINQALAPLDLKAFYDASTGQSPGLMLLDRPLQTTKVIHMQDPDSLIPADQIIGSGSEENREPPLGGGAPVDNQHRKIDGYRDLNQATIDQINEVKAAERKLAVLIKKLGEEGANPRDLALARTNLQQGLMWLTRAVSHPQDPWS